MNTTKEDMPFGIITPRESKPEKETYDKGCCSAVSTLPCVTSLDVPYYYLISFGVLSCLHPSINNNAHGITIKLYFCTQNTISNSRS